jgi:hypothetical protein
LTTRRRLGIVGAPTVSDLAARARPDPPGPATVGDRLRSARRRRFVGRAAELELFREAITASEPAFAVLFIHGPGGVGKTALLGALADEARETGLAAVRVDLRAIDPSPPAFLEAVAAALPLAGAGGALDALQRGPRRVLLLDTYESAGALDGWLRETLLPRLPVGTLVIAAGRNPPGPQWRSDPAWQELLRAVSLRNLDAGDARAYLRAAAVPELLHERALALTHGHPLALALLVDVLAQRPQAALTEAPDAVRALVQRFADDLPGPRHKAALEVAAHARVTTEDLLRAALGGDDAAELFAWLRGLSFVEDSADGAFPHDLVRDVLDADLRWRAPDTYLDRHRRIRAHVVDRIRRSGSRDAQGEVANLVFMHRHNPRFAAFVDWSAFGRAYVDALRPGDGPELLAITARHEGESSAALVEHWLARQPRAFIVFRGHEQPVLGFATLLALHEASDADVAADPGARAMWAYAQQHGAPRPGEEVFAARFLVDREAHQRPSPSLSLITVAHTQHIFGRARPAWEFLGPWVDPDWIEPLMMHIDFHRAPEADYEVAGRRYGVFAHDWRRTPLEPWLELTADRELDRGDEPLPRPDPPPDELALSQPEFIEAVRRALRDLHRPGALAANPLMRSRAARDRAGPAPTPEAIRDLLADAIDALRVDPRDAKLHRALARTYVRPAQTQELAADALGLPFSTYRRHLTRGVERVVEWLWQRELYGPEG